MGAAGAVAGKLRALAKRIGSRLAAVGRGIVRGAKWFGGKARQIVGVDIIDAIPISGAEPKSLLLTVAVRYREANEETYSIPIISVAHGELLDDAFSRAGQPGHGFGIASHHAAMYAVGYAGLIHGHDQRGLAAELDLAVTAGSDCHGPEPAGRAVGARTVTAPELEHLRQLASR